MRHLLGGLPDSLIIFIFYSFLLFGAFLSYKWKHSLEKKNQFFYILFVFHILNFYIIYSIFTVPPDKISGNGNPHIPYIFISAILFIYFCVLFSFCAHEKTFNKSMLFKLMVIGISLLISCLTVALEIRFIMIIQKQLVYPIGEWWLWWTDIHLNSIFFNPYSFLFGISLAVFAGAVFSLLKALGKQSHF